MRRFEREHIRREKTRGFARARGFEGAGGFELYRKLYTTRADSSRRKTMVTPSVSRLSSIPVSTRDSALYHPAIYPLCGSPSRGVL